MILQNYRMTATDQFKKESKNHMNNLKSTWLQFYGERKREKWFSKEMGIHKSSKGKVNIHWKV